MRQFGLDRDTVDVENCLKIEPALADARPCWWAAITPLRRVRRCPQVHPGPGRQAQAAGVEFRHGTTIERIATAAAGSPVSSSAMATGRNC
jgi:D-amino-acid dehydrogenase